MRNVSIARKSTLALAVLGCTLLIGARQARADGITIVTNQIGFGDDVVDWAQLPIGTDVNNTTPFTSAGGLSVAVSQPEYGLGLWQSGPPQSYEPFPGDFTVGTAVLTNWNSYFHVTISFSGPVFGAGLNVEPAQYYGTPLNIYVAAYDDGDLLGTGSIVATNSDSFDGSVPFLGVESTTANITSLVYWRDNVTNDGNDPGSIGMGPMLLQTGDPVPEPSPITLLLTGLLLLVGFKLKVKMSDRGTAPL